MVGRVEPKSIPADGDGATAGFAPRNAALRRGGSSAERESGAGESLHSVAAKPETGL